MSFQITLSPAERAAGRFVGKVRRSLQKALASRPELTQSAIAAELGVNRSVIHRQLRGSADLSLSRVAELATILGFEPEFTLVPTGPEPGQNVAMPTPFTSIEVSSSASISAGRSSTAPLFAVAAVS